MFDQIIDYYEDQQLPYKAQIELTKACNFKCLHCYQLDTRMYHKQILRHDAWSELLQTLREKGVILIRMTGGEPTVHPDFIEIYKTAAKLGLKVELQTNGSLLTEEIVETLTEYWPFRVRMSVYGFSKDTYDSFCKSSNGYERVKHSLDRLTEVGVPLYIAALTTRENVHDVENLLEYCEDQRINVGVYTNIGSSLGGDTLSGRLMISPDEMNRLFTKQPRLEKKIKQQWKDKDEYSLWEDDVKVCGAGKHSVFIDEMHNMFLCQITRMHSVSLIESNFDEAWTTMLKKRKSVIERPHDCTYCIHRDRCGKCAGFFEVGDKLNKYNCFILSKGLPLNEITTQLPFESPEVQALLTNPSPTKISFNVLNNKHLGSGCGSGISGGSCGSAISSQHSGGGCGTQCGCG